MTRLRFGAAQSKIRAMRRLLLLRHAKTIPATGRNDYERALVDRGRRDAAGIGAFVAESGLIPDLVIFSGAQRAERNGVDRR